MTVAAVILALRPEVALVDADGLPRVRRVADAAWSGGCLPVVVVTADPDGAVAAALAGAPVTVAEAGPIAGGPAAFIGRGLDVALAEVSGVTAALVWPARWPWVGPETATSLIEAHGREPGTVLRPTFEGAGGWPVLVPAAAREILAGISAALPPEDALRAVATALGDRTIELGDPGVTHDGFVARTDLPPYAGPPEPPAGHRHEWGSTAAETPDDAPLPSPAVAPFEAEPEPGA